MDSALRFLTASALETKRKLEEEEKVAKKVKAKVEEEEEEEDRVRRKTPNGWVLAWPRTATVSSTIGTVSHTARFGRFPPAPLGRNRRKGEEDMYEFWTTKGAAPRTAWL